METPENRYDELPYESRPFTHSHPDHLAALGALFGRDAAPPERCRVLELGCADAGNIAPMAFLFPQSRFVGLDSAARAIETGRRTVQSLGLENLELLQLDFAAVPADLGTFDYIICHGILSWVPPGKRQSIFEICRRHLSADGLAYISYNTYPGWHLRSVLRDLLFFYAAGAPDAKNAAAAAKRAALLFSKTVHPGDSLEVKFVKSMAAAVEQLPDWYLFHDLLEPDNYPLYFSDFLREAEVHELRYLADADPTMISPELPAEALQLLPLERETELREQALDFLTVKLFRRSVLCRRGSPQGSAELQPKAVEKMHAAALLSPLGEGENRAASASSFVAPNGGLYETTDNFVQQAILLLADAYPRALPVAQLFEDVQLRAPGRLGRAAAKPDRRAQFYSALVDLWLRGYLRLSVNPPQPAVSVSGKPRAFEPARRQAAAGQSAVNLWHEQIDLDAFAGQILALLDGSRSIEQLSGSARSILAQESRKSDAAALLVEALQSLMRAGLLVA